MQLVCMTGGRCGRPTCNEKRETERLQSRIMSRSTLTSHQSKAADSATTEIETTAASEQSHCVRLSARSFGLSDRGKIRDTNEDQFLIAELFKALRIESTSLPHRQFKRSDDSSQVFIVADGMGAGRAA